MAEATAQAQAHPQASEAEAKRRNRTPILEREVDPVDRLGNRIVGVGLLALAVAWTTGVFGVAFLLEASVVASVVLGIRMTKGSFGASGFYGRAMVVLSLLAAVIFLFWPAIGMGLRVGYSAWLLGGALGKLLDLW